MVGHKDPEDFGKPLSRIRSVAGNRRFLTLVLDVGTVLTSKGPSVLAHEPVAVMTKFVSQYPIGFPVCHRSRPRPVPAFHGSARGLTFLQADIDPRSVSPFVESTFFGLKQVSTTLVVRSVEGTRSTEKPSIPRDHGNGRTLDTVRTTEQVDPPQAHLIELDLTGWPRLDRNWRHDRFTRKAWFRKQFLESTLQTPVNYLYGHEDGCDKQETESIDPLHD